MSTISEALAEAYASAPADVFVYHTLELRHPSFSSPIRVVRDYQDLVATLEATAPLDPGAAVTFTAVTFDFALPDLDDQNAVPEMTITIDNVPAAMMPYFDQAADSNDKVQMTYRPYVSGDTLSGPDMNPPLTLTIVQLQADVQKVTARATFSDLANKRFPGVDYDADTFPGLIYES